MLPSSFVPRLTQGGRDAAALLGQGGGKGGKGHHRQGADSHVVGESFFPENLLSVAGLCRSFHVLLLLVFLWVITALLIAVPPREKESQSTRGW